MLAVRIRTTNLYSRRERENHKSTQTSYDRISLGACSSVKNRLHSHFVKINKCKRHVERKANKVDRNK